MKKIKIEIPPNYTIRFAEKTDVENIMKFFKEHWKDNHILACNRTFFEYEFCRNDEVCFVLLINEQEKIIGTLGYIPYGQTDRDIFMVMWKVIGNNGLFLGIALLYYLIEHGKCRHIYTCGLNKSTVNIYKYLGLEVVSLSHYYMVNSAMEQNVARFKDTAAFVENNQVPEVEWVECDVNEFEKSYQPVVNSTHIYKTCDYLIHRYFLNPKYNYRVYRLIKNNKAYFIVFRVQIYHGSKILRVIDYFGDIFWEVEISNLIKKIIYEEKFEYADMYAYGLDKSDLLKVGFQIVTEDSEDIVPDYFSPYELKNVEILAMFEKNMSPFIFKGDGDQDRPS